MDLSDGRYAFMKATLNSDYGVILVDTDVIATYAGSVAVGCFGIVGMSGYSMKDGLFHILKKDSLHRGINVTLTEDNRISLSLHCIVAYGVSIVTVCDNLIESLIYRVEQFTGIKVERVDVVVEGIRVID
jgi:uncharacterized alkaline shock family protein YloU